MNTPIDKYAPVLIPTLCRYEHFKECIESLAACTHARETILYVALDFPAKESHEDGYNKIKLFLPQITGFKDVVIIERQHNYGALENMNDAISTVFSKFDRLIFTEDDNVFAPGFLDFVNKGLCKYESEGEVLSISGYCHPVEGLSSSNSHFFLPNFSAWGVGYWRNKFQANRNQYVNMEYARKVLLSFKSSMNLFKKSPRILARLMSMYWNRQVHTDTLIVAAELNENLYSVFPTQSFVQNHGFDGSGLNCWHTELQKQFTEQPISTATSVTLDTVGKTRNPKIEKSFYRYFNPSKRRTIMTFGAYIALRLAMSFHLR